VLGHTVGWRLESLSSTSRKVSARHLWASPSRYWAFQPNVIMQDAAIQTLVMQGVLDGDAFGMGQVRLVEEALPVELSMKVQAANADQSDLMTFLFNDLDAVPFEGLNGLKDRTGLGSFDMTSHNPRLSVTRMVVKREAHSVYDAKFHPRLNIIRGENSSGKSTVLDFLFYGLEAT
jgi:hypothetical protein